MANKFKKSFRKNKRIKHPTYVIDEYGNMYKYIGVTHSSETNGVKNIKLNNNPNPNDKQVAYLRPRVDIDKQSNFGHRYETWRFSEDDKKKVRNIIDTHEKKK